MLRTVARFFNPWEAHILRARLVAEGIPATVGGDQHMMADWPLTLALGGAQLQVPASCLDQAREILADYHAGRLREELLAEIPEAQESCPRCASADVRASVPASQRILLFALWILGAPFPTHASTCRCGSCRHRWTYSSPQA